MGFLGNIKLFWRLILSFVLTSWDHAYWIICSHNLQPLKAFPPPILKSSLAMDILSLVLQWPWKLHLVVSNVLLTWNSKGQFLVTFREFYCRQFVSFFLGGLCCIKIKLYHVSILSSCRKSMQNKFTFIILPLWYHTTLFHISFPLQQYILFIANVTFIINIASF